MLVFASEDTSCSTKPKIKSFGIDDICTLISAYTPYGVVGHMKALFPIFLIDFGSVTCISLLQYTKAPVSISSSPSFNTNSVSLWQQWKAAIPIFLICGGKTSFEIAQPANMFWQPFSPIRSKPCPKSIFSRLLHP